MVSSLVCGTVTPRISLNPSQALNTCRCRCGSLPQKNVQPMAGLKIRPEQDDCTTTKVRGFSQNMLQRCVVPLAASFAVILCSSPAHAGLLSGFSGLESVPGPELPQIDFLNRWNEENQKKYAEADARFKESPLLKKLLEKSQLNKEKNKQAIMDKYCIRGAEWGVGDCSTAAMTPEERDTFIAMLKQKAGVE